MSAFEIVAGKHRASLAVSYSGEQRVSVAVAVLHPRYEYDPGYSGTSLSVCLSLCLSVCLSLLAGFTCFMIIKITTTATTTTIINAFLICQILL